MKYAQKIEINGKDIWHECSIYSLINIIISGHFRPFSIDSLGYDSGLNCYSDENAHIWNSAAGTGAKLKMKWIGKIRYIDDQVRTPYPTSKLIIDPTWRTFIPVRSDPSLCLIVGFEINDQQELMKYFQSKVGSLSHTPILGKSLFFVWQKLWFYRLVSIVNNNSGLTIE